jgi:ribonuclease D
MPSLNYKVLKTPEQLALAVESLFQHPVIGLDTETTDLDPYNSRLRLIQLATPTAVYIVDVACWRHRGQSRLLTMLNSTPSFSSMF